MPFIRSLASKRRAHVVGTIILLSEIMLSCSWCVKKKLLYIAIIAPPSCQPSSARENNFNFCSKRVHDISVMTVPPHSMAPLVLRPLVP